jgi:hypothetical protein
MWRFSFKFSLFSLIAYSRVLSILLRFISHQVCHSIFTIIIIIEQQTIDNVAVVEVVKNSCHFGGEDYIT